MSSTIQIRIDPATKKSVQKVLDGIGIDMSAAVKVYLKQIIIYQGIPLTLMTENGLTPKEEKTIMKASDEVRKGKHVTKIMDLKEAIDYLKSL